ncbi:MAG: bifunctional oligoribonuclease/PAP phosphatase NrnA [Bacteroidetes bacterium]|nr:bifunctional oligoribonuclease/PAP phosphatase NrnA [Bacteroidota bacterium]
MLTDTTGPLVEKLKARNYQKAVITTHHKPDGDAMGSALGLYSFLTSFVTHVQVVTPTDYPEFLNWLPGNDTVLIYEGNETEGARITNEADLVFCLDFNRLSRINEYGEVVRNCRAEKVLIDHHLEPECFEDYTFWDTHSSSSSELVFHFIKHYFGIEHLSKDGATCLYTGLMTDTGNFQHNNTNSTTHMVAAELLDKGADHVKIHEQIYDVFSLDRSRLFGYCLYHKLEVLPELRTALIYLSADELKEFNVRTGDTEGLVNFGLSLKGIVLSVLIIDRTKLVKMSFRSKGDFAANEYAARYFNGGGHRNAAGGQSDRPLEEVVTRFKDTIKLYATELNAI